MIVLRCICILIFALIIEIQSANRLPRAIDDDDYDKLKHALQTREITANRERTNQDRRVSRWYLSGSYLLKTVFDPIKEIEEEMLVSLSGLSIIYLNEYCTL